MGGEGYHGRIGIRPRGGRARKFLAGEWPENPSLRFLVHWGLRRDELCDVGLCHDAPGDGTRCDHCPVDRLEAAQNSEAGQLIRRAVDLRACLNLGLTLSLEDIDADELYAMLIIEEERNRYDSEKARKD